ncbi:MULTISPECIES: GntR family transcriptional regulator [unclassified Gordonia (in: high G+C Gram-positive bacteria)]|uniref:GntR family transcriptional regulator n=1 Tax=unclassified Gordonia (in: high G+C Gram-positive bacteria) TaxID=2657482 RepID=UPI0007E96671|nr:MULTISPECIES: GntR family transcriptional regulator [unclassified Gordonia (in: high G+C Gram-positive bacteria)]OBB99819.1 GntR family transcriptional regulator [Gordonia sp. 852002-50395_SCH5434458]OBC09490.1 GntR family transcriptional regulator [Gordonia sp. 852002-50816_SCH5313054-a]OBC13292.1 GntR family transcriptional regulator [Gordonia sp. 852002-50816_SCH5313054-c]
MSADVPARTRRRRPRLSDEAAEHVRELIVSGQLEPGQFIRPETMAAELDISATPMREGLLTLQSEGLLRVEPRRGFMVSPLSANDIEDVFVGQSLLAGELAARATSRMSDDELDALEKIQADLEHAADTADYDEVERLNHVFHRSIYSAAGSPKLSWMIKGSLNYAPRRFFASVDGWPQASAADHRAIIAGLRARDGEAARAAMVDHIRNAGRLLAAQR